MNSRSVTLAVAALGIVVVAGACGKKITAPVSTTVTFSATMTGAKENPAVTTAGSGTFTATLDTVTNVFTYDLTFTGLTSIVNNGHIHGPANATTNSGTILNFNTLAGATFGLGLLSGAGHGSVVLNAATQISATVNGDSLKKLLFAGMTYANVHTTTNTGGEIRGQITKQ